MKLLFMTMIMIHWLEDILWLQVVLNLKKKVLFVNTVTRHLVAFKRNNQKYKGGVVV